MNSRNFSKALLTILFIAGLVVAPNVVLAQEYTEEDYNVFQGVQAEKDDAKKIDMIVKFLTEKPKNPLRPNLVNEYQKVIVDLSNAERWSQIIVLGDKILDVAPNDDVVVRTMTVAYAKTNNTKGFATFGERVYGSKPSPELAMEIARAYEKLGNSAKALQWKEKVLTSDPDNIEILAETMKKHVAAQNMAQALKYARNCLKVLPTATKPDSMDAATWKATTDQTYAIAYGVIGQDAYQNRSYGVAIKNLEQAVKFFKRNDAAYYVLGLCYWQSNKLDAAMLNLAKAYVIKGAHANSAKQQLDQLWKNTHKGTLTGQNRIIERAQQDLK